MVDRATEGLAPNPRLGDRANDPNINTANGANADKLNLIKLSWIKLNLSKPCLLANPRRLAEGNCKKQRPDRQRQNQNVGNAFHRSFPNNFSSVYQARVENVQFPKSRQVRIYNLQQSSEKELPKKNFQKNIELALKTVCSGRSAPPPNTPKTRRESLEFQTLPLICGLPRGQSLTLSTPKLE
jgi:hypothetical protein